MVAKRLRDAGKMTQEQYKAAHMRLSRKLLELEMRESVILETL